MKSFDDFRASLTDEDLLDISCIRGAFDRQYDLSTEEGRSDLVGDVLAAARESTFRILAQYHAWFSKQL